MVLKVECFLALLVADGCLCLFRVVIERVAYKPLRKIDSCGCINYSHRGFIFIRKCNELFWSGVPSVPFVDLEQRHSLYSETFQWMGKQILIFDYSFINGFITIYRSLYKNGESYACRCCWWTNSSIHGDWREGGFHFTLPLGQLCWDCRCPCWRLLQYHFYNNGITVGLKSLRCSCTWWYRKYSWSDGRWLSHRSIRNNGASSGIHRISADGVVLSPYYLLF